MCSSGPGRRGQCAGLGPGHCPLISFGCIQIAVGLMSQGGSRVEKCFDKPLKALHYAGGQCYWSVVIEVLGFWGTGTTMVFLKQTVE